MDSNYKLSLFKVIMIIFIFLFNTINELTVLSNLESHNAEKIKVLGCNTEID